MGCITLFSINKELMAYVLKSEPAILKIRHLYDQQYSDLATTYPNPIRRIHITDFNHLVVVNEANQVDIVYLKTSSVLQLINIKSFQKSGLLDVTVANNLVAMMTENKLHILELQANNCISNFKSDLPVPPVKATFSGQNLYIYCSDNTIRRWGKNPTGKFEQGSEVINLKEEIVQINSVTN